MPITTCTMCEKAYDAWSEESANELGRLCPECNGKEAEDAALGLHEMVKDLEKENAALKEEVGRLREAVEWACELPNDLDDPRMSVRGRFKAELRRRAEGEEGK